MPGITKLAHAKAVQQVGEACFGYAMGRLAKLKPASTIAHYTTADTALQIIQGRSFWLRNAQLMNDYSELEYGDACLTNVFSQAVVREKMAQVLDQISPGFSAQLLATWDTKKAEAKRLTYIGSLSEIRRDDPLGRLSMWRAYGGRAGVALCLNPKLLEIDTTELAVFHSPVLYGGVDTLQVEMMNLLERLGGLQGEMQAIGPDAVAHYLGNAVRYAVLSLKHPGFEEEQEWRMIYSLDEGANPHIKHEAVSIGGVPQVVCQVPLSNAEGLQIQELGIDQIFERIVIGPCEFPDQVRMALLKAFDDHGAPYPKIDISNIPLRQH